MPKFAPAPRMPQNSSGSSFRAGPHEPPVGGHELDRAEAVNRQPEMALEPADPSAERQPGDACMADDADRTHEPMLLGGDVELAEKRSTTRPRDALRGVDADIVHTAKVNDDPAVGRGMSKRAVTAAADGDFEVPFPAEPDRRDDIVDAGRPNHGGRSAIERRVPDPAGIVVARGVRGDDFAGKGGAKFVELDACRYDHAESLADVRFDACGRRRSRHCSSISTGSGIACSRRPARQEFDSVRATLVHELDVESGWRARLRGDEETDLDPANYPTLDAIADHWHRDELEMRGWLASLTDEALATPPPHEMNQAFPLWYYLVHVVCHGIQELEETVVLLGPSGNSPRDLGFLDYADTTIDRGGTSARP